MDINVKTSGPIRWGIVGAGNIARQAVAPAIRLTPGAELTAVASRNAEKAGKLAAELQAGRAYGSYEELIADPEIDAVYIGLPNGLHEEWTLAALTMGKHVLCEKSLAFTRESAMRMAAAARRARRHLAEAFMYRHHPQWETARGIIATGRLGRVAGIRAIFTSHLPDDANHRWSADLGMGALYDLGCYSVDVCRYLLGVEPVSVAAHGTAHGKEMVDGTMHISMEFPPGVPATAIGSLISAFEQSVVVTGERRLMRIHQPFVPRDQPARITIEDRDVLEEIMVPGANHFLSQVCHFTDCIAGRRRDAYPAEDGVGNSTACEAALRSWREKRTILL